MKIFRGVFITATLFALAVLAVGQLALAGAGTRGGEVAYINGKYINRDFLESRKDCWISGTEIENRNPAIVRILNSIKRVDWYYAMTLQKKLHTLNFCFGGALRPLEFDSRQSPRMNANVRTEFVALQTTDGLVFEDSHLLTQLDDFKVTKEEARAFHFLHEATHPLLSADTPDQERREAIWEMVSLYRDIYLGLVTTRDRLYQVVAARGFDFPVTSSYLDPYRKQIEFLLGDNDQTSKTFFSSRSLDKAMDKNLGFIKQYLRSEDQISSFDNPLEALKSYVEQILRDGDDAQVSYVFNKAGFTVIDPNTMALGIYKDLSDDQQRALFANAKLVPIAKEALETLGKADVKVKMGLIYANKSLLRLSNENAETNPVMVMSLHPLAGKGTVPREITLLGNIASFLETKNDNYALTEIFDSKEFYDAFNLTRAKYSVAAANNLVPREKVYATEALDHLREGLSTTFYNYLQGVLDQRAFEDIKTKFHWERLGTVSVPEKTED